MCIAIPLSLAPGFAMSGPLAGSRSILAAVRCALPQPEGSRTGLKEIAQYRWSCGLDFRHSLCSCPRVGATHSTMLLDTYEAASLMPCAASLTAALLLEGAVVTALCAIPPGDPEKAGLRSKAGYDIGCDIQ